MSVCSTKCCSCTLKLKNCTITKFFINSLSLCTFCYVMIFAVNISLVFIWPQTHLLQLRFSHHLAATSEIFVHISKSAFMHVAVTLLIIHDYYGLRHRVSQVLTVNCNVYFPSLRTVELSHKVHTVIKLLSNHSLHISE